MRERQLDIVPVNVGLIPSYFRSGVLPCDVVFVKLGLPGPDGRYSLGASNLHLEAAIGMARTVIAEINPHVPHSFGGLTLSPEQISLFVPTDTPLPESASAAVSQTDLGIAAHVATFIDDGATLQIGIGSVPDALLQSLTDRRGLGIHSGVIGDAVVDLIQGGVVTNEHKPFDRGITVSGMLLGTRRLYDFAHRNPVLHIRPTEHTHGEAVLRALPKLVTINSAVEVDLSGQVNAEVAGSVYLGGVGGQPDFVRGGHRNSGGRSIIALPSTARGGTESRITIDLTGPVTTPRSDVDVVVTEFGAAELRGKGFADRAKRLAKISHPDFREKHERSAYAIARSAG